SHRLFLQRIIENDEWCPHRFRLGRHPACQADAEPGHPPEKPFPIHCTQGPTSSFFGTVTAAVTILFESGPSRFSQTNKFLSGRNAGQVRGWVLPARLLDGDPVAALFLGLVQRQIGPRQEVRCVIGVAGDHAEYTETDGQVEWSLAGL